MASEVIDHIVSIALRTAVRGPMREVARAEAVADGGLVGDMPEKRVERGITFISAQQWASVMTTLGVDLPWPTRRANVLIDADTLGPWIGRVVRIGAHVRVHIFGETKPCGLMDQYHQGLRSALSDECRGGVFGRVLTGGPIHIGDMIEFAGSEAESTVA